MKSFQILKVPSRGLNIEAILSFWTPTWCLKISLWKTPHVIHSLSIMILEKHQESEKCTPGCPWLAILSPCCQENFFLFKFWSVPHGPTCGILQLCSMVPPGPTCGILQLCSIKMKIYDFFVTNEHWKLELWTIKHFIIYFSRINWVQFLIGEFNLGLVVRRLCQCLGVVMVVVVVAAVVVDCWSSGEDAYGEIFGD